MTWHPLWPTRDEVAAVLRDRKLYYKPPLPDGVPWVVEEHHVRILLTDPAWALWVMNPLMDHLMPPSRANKQHWINMCLTPIHAPCKAAIRIVGPAFMQRVLCGEVAQSHRPRYITGSLFDVPDIIY